MAVSRHIVRSVCCFQNTVDQESRKRVKALSSQLRGIGFEVQTERIVTRGTAVNVLEERVNDPEIFLGLGSVTLEEAEDQFEAFARSRMVSFHVDLTEEEITPAHVNWLWRMMTQCPDRMFRVAFCFSNPVSSPYFPSSKYEEDGFSIGLQSTDLAADCDSLEAWFDAMKRAWDDILQIFDRMPGFLGIDSSIAPMGGESGSLIDIVNRCCHGFQSAVLSDAFLKMTRFIKENNPKPVGLCGLMLPCLEDFQLAGLYEKGSFSLERNLFLSLHSGLGIDTYPIGIDESKERVLNILKLVQGLSRKYQKPLSIRLVSDGKAKTGEKTDFKNIYLKDVVIQKLSVN